MGNDAAHSTFQVLHEKLRVAIATKATTRGNVWHTDKVEDKVIEASIRGLAHFN